MRLFVAVELDDSVRRTAVKAADDLRRSFGSALRPKWIDASHLHLTVRFIGHVGDDRVPAVLEAIAPPLAIAPFEIALGECGVFPPHGPPRVLWIGVREGLTSLQALHQEFNRRLLPFGYQPDNRPFSAHLTLARVKDAPRGSGVAVREALRAVRVPPVRWRVEHATVFQSILSPRGSTYRLLLNVNLEP